MILKPLSVVPPFGESWSIGVVEKWSPGVLEYWSNGLIRIACYNQSKLKGISTRNEFYLFHHSNIPLLQHSSTPVLPNAIQRKANKL
jgi:hypothetical protein